MQKYGYERGATVRVVYKCNKKLLLLLLLFITCKIHFDQISIKLNL